MSSYHLNRFLFDLKMNDSVFQEALADLKRAMSRYELTPEDREALGAGDPRKLRQLGAHGMLALYIMRLNPEFRTNVYWSQK
ncbi:MAG: hypothetical protein HY694_02585 [Deltaproteobacteria bacterium]|nr:hypothetical protein [Deltaproteobacteria bacterium]